MESLQNIKRRLKSVHNINQITKAMELVAATKMRKSQEIALASRPYALAALDLLAKLSETEQSAASPLLQKRKVKRTAVVLVTSDKGLAGSFNSSVIRAFEKVLREKNTNISKENDCFVAVGQKAAMYLEKNITLSQKFVRFGDHATIEQIKPLADHLINGYAKNEWDRVLVFSTHFKTALRQVVLMRQILPVEIESLKATAKEIVPETGRFSELVKENGVSFFNGKSELASEYLLEPSSATIIQELVPHLVLMQIYHLILETNASEHATRRVAMKSASDNASELADNLTLVYNKSRQAGITRELIEITASAEALGA
ncbi:MAG: ATP synthase F1 subunit gamma [Patescibacteria group bacterium]